LASEWIRQQTQWAGLSFAEQVAVEGAIAEMNRQVTTLLGAEKKQLKKKTLESEKLALDQPSYAKPERRLSKYQLSLKGIKCLKQREPGPRRMQPSFIMQLQDFHFRSLKTQDEVRFQ